MFTFLKIFESREPYTEDYQVPAIEVLNDQSGGVLILPPGAPTVVGITAAGLEWETISTATGYYVEELTQGTIWTQIANVSQPASVQIVWNLTEWDMNVFTSGAWVTLYRSTDDTPTPDLATPWTVETGTTPVPTVVAGGPVGSGGMNVSGAGDARVNTPFQVAGTLNGKTYYSSPEVATFAFTPSVNSLYRVRAYNAAGAGAPSNAQQY